VALPIILLYELGIWLAKLARIGQRNVSVESAASEQSGH
jgi:Sec-independent protein secretion pathway component TatC